MCFQVFMSYMARLNLSEKDTVFQSLSLQAPFQYFTHMNSFSKVLIIYIYSQKCKVHVLHI